MPGMVVEPDPGWCLVVVVVVVSGGASQVIDGGRANKLKLTPAC